MWQGYDVFPSQNVLAKINYKNKKKKPTDSYTKCIVAAESEPKMYLFPKAWYADNGIYVDYIG